MSKHVVVLVLGDVGRSPRMQFHARSFASMSEVSRVTMIGYEGERPMPDLLSNSKVHFQFIPSVNLPSIRFISFLRAIIKGFLLLFSIFTCLWSIPSYQLIVIQNPPCLPAVVVAYLFSLCNGSKILIDWHNLGFSIYENSMGRRTNLVKFTYFLEKYFCKYFAHLHICVSKALKQWLKENFSIDAEVLYDRPGAVISEKNFSLENRHALLTKLQLTDEIFFGVPKSEQKDAIESTVQTNKLPSGHIERRGSQEELKTALVVSSTSWTVDEDFSILLQTLEELEKFLYENKSNPERMNWPFHRILCVITGKGELKAFYEVKIGEFNKRSQFVKMKTLWLEYIDYPKLLHCSDVGVSLHTSTSGLDLPMKVLDMFGSSLPVLAIDFPTIHELVKDSYNGLVFRSQHELYALFIKTFFSSVHDEKLLLPRLRENCRKIENWEYNWKVVMLSIVSNILCN